MLSVASVIGRKFALETLKNVATMPEEVFMKALQEAVHLAILEERSQVGSSATVSPMPSSARPYMRN